MVPAGRNWALQAPVLRGLGGLTCFVGDCVGFGHRLLVAQVDGRAPLKTHAGSGSQRGAEHQKSLRWTREELLSASIQQLTSSGQSVLALASLRKSDIIS